MKAKEFMIGDWVYCRSCDKVPLQVAGVEDGKIRLKHSCQYDIEKKTYTRIEQPSVIDEKDCLPIPIDQDILEENDFEYERNIGRVYDDWCNSAKVIYDSWNHLLKILTDYDITLNKKCFGEMYVHEFQHALLLCGIDKEITISFPRSSCLKK